MKTKWVKIKRADGSIVYDRLRDASRSLRWLAPLRFSSVNEAKEELLKGAEIIIGVGKSMKSYQLHEGDIF